MGRNATAHLGQHMCSTHDQVVYVYIYPYVDA